MSFIKAQKLVQIEKELKRVNSWIVVDVFNTHHHGFSGFVAVVESSIVFRFLTPILRLVYISKLGEYLYGHIAKHRKHVCHFEKVHKITETVK